MSRHLHQGGDCSPNGYTDNKKNLSQLKTFISKVMSTQCDDKIKHLEASRRNLTNRLEQRSPIKLKCSNEFVSRSNPHAPYNKEQSSLNTPTPKRSVSPIEVTRSVNRPFKKLRNYLEMPRTMKIQPDFEEQISEIKQVHGMSIVSTDTCISRPIVINELDSFDALRHHQDKPDSSLESRGSPTNSAGEATVQSYQRIVQGLEDEVKALRRSLDVQRQGETARVKLELGKMSEKHRREVESLQRAFDRESKVKQDAIMSALSSKYNSDLQEIRADYEKKLSKLQFRRPPTDTQSPFEQNPYYQGHPSDQHEDRSTHSPLANYSRLTTDIGDGDTFTSILLGKDPITPEEQLIQENKRLRGALASALCTSSGMCSCCRKLTSATESLDSYVTSLKYLLE